MADIRGCKSLVRSRYGRVVGRALRLVAVCAGSVLGLVATAASIVAVWRDEGEVAVADSTIALVAVSVLALLRRYHRPDV